MPSVKYNVHSSFADVPVRMPANEWPFTRCEVSDRVMKGLSFENSFEELASKPGYESTWVSGEVDKDPRTPYGIFMTIRTKSIMAGSVLLVMVIGAWLLAGCIGAGPTSSVVSRGKTKFPALTGTNLTGLQVDVPMGLQGTQRLVAVAFLQEQQSDVDTWVAHLDELRKTRPELTFYEIPMIYKGSVFFRFWLNNGMRAGIPDEQKRRSTITVYTDVEAFLKEIGAPNNQQIQIFLLDGEGTILGRTAGPYMLEKATELFATAKD